MISKEEVNMELGRINEESYLKLGPVAAQYVLDQIKDLVTLEDFDPDEKERMIELLMRTIQVAISITSEFCHSDYLDLTKLTEVHKLMEDGKYQEAHDRMIKEYN